MKFRKYMRLIGMLVVAVSLFCVAWNREEFTIYLLRVGSVRGGSNGDTITIVDPVSFTGEAAVDGKYTIVGGDATTGLMLQKAAITATGTTMTNTFAVIFGAAPIVVCSYTEDPGDVRPVFVTSVTATNFISTHASSINYGYIAVGTRP